MNNAAYNGLDSLDHDAVNSLMRSVQVTDVETFGSGSTFLPGSPCRRARMEDRQTITRTRSWQVSQHLLLYTSLVAETWKILILTHRILTKRLLKKYLMYYVFLVNSLDFCIWTRHSTSTSPPPPASATCISASVRPNRRQPLCAATKGARTQYSSASGWTRCW